MDKEKLFSWIDLDDKKLSWLINYVGQRIAISNFGNPPYSLEDVGKITDDICRVKNNDSLILFMNKTRAAWNQYQRREIRKKSYVTSTLEIKKEVYQNALQIAKKYKIPTNFAIEELIKKGCELEEKQLKNEKEGKQLSSIKNDLVKKRQSRLVELNINEQKLLSFEDISKKLTSEMFEKHCIEIQLIKLAVDKNQEKMKDEISKEKERYVKDCKKYEVDCLEVKSDP